MFFFVFNDLRWEVDVLLCVQWFEVRGWCSICWYCWNYWPSLFKLSFQNIDCRKSMYIIVFLCFVSICFALFRIVSICFASIRFLSICFALFRFYLLKALIRFVSICYVSIRFFLDSFRLYSIYFSLIRFVSICFALVRFSSNVFPWFVSFLLPVPSA